MNQITFFKIYQPVIISAWKQTVNELVKTEVLKLGDAIEFYNGVLKIVPENAIAWNEKGTVFYNLRKYEALKCDDTAIRIDPKNVFAWYNKGRVFGELLQKYDEAMKFYEKAIEVNPRNVYGWIGKGTVFHHLRNMMRQ